jgi:hypothetical protein
MKIIKTSDKKIIEVSIQNSINALYQHIAP